MEEELKYTSKFDGPTTDEVLEHAKSVKDLTIPSLSEISGFVCINKEGNAIGMMSKEQVAQVVGGLVNDKDIRLVRYYRVEKEVYTGDLNLLDGNKYVRLGSEASNFPDGENPLGTIVQCVEWDANASFQVYYGCNTGNVYHRSKFQSKWIAWVKY